MEWKLTSGSDPVASSGDFDHITGHPSYGLLDPELVEFLRINPLPPMGPETYLQIRAMSRAMFPQRSGSDDDPEIVVAPGTFGQPDVAMHLRRPSAPGQSGLPVYFHIHAGGFVAGMPESDALRMAAFAQQTRCIVADVAYRLAPETVYPGAVEDCYHALLWLHRNAARLGGDPARIVIGGESAGGGLAAALALLVRDRGEIPLAGQLLIYPMIDDRTGSTVQPHLYAGAFVWTAASNRFGWQSLLGKPPGGDDTPPYAAAARASNLSGLPATLLCVPALDLFVDECIDYGRRLIEAGVPTDMHVYAGAYHGFDMFNSAEISRRLADDVVRAFRRFTSLPAIE